MTKIALQTLSNETACDYIIANGSIVKDIEISLSKRLVHVIFDNRMFQIFWNESIVIECRTKTKIYL